MCPANSFQLTQRAAELYERQKVSAIFRPLAEATIDALDGPPEGPVLDVACGTGIIARVLRRRFGGAPDITGLDLNADMVAVARELCAPLEGRFDWQVAPADDMGLPTGQFGTCFCQQGIQFFPDDGKALAEMKRVLRPGGKVILTVWAGPSAYFVAQAAAMGRHLGQGAANQALLPFAYDGERRLPVVLAEAGFSQIEIRPLAVTRVIEKAARGVAEDIEGSPLAAHVAAGAAGCLDRIVTDILHDCRGFLSDGDLRIPQNANMVLATA